MSEYISALVKRPGEIPRHVNVSNSLEALQKNVGGYIEVVTIFPYDEETGKDGLCVICNEEGRLQGLPHNCTIFGYDFVGDILMVGVHGEEFSNMPLTWTQLKTFFSDLWEVE